MILSGKKIQACMGKEIIIYPFDPKRINPNSYNLTLNRELLVYENDLLDMKRPNPVQKLLIPENGLLRTAMSPCWRGVPPPAGWDFLFM